MDEIKCKHCEFMDSVFNRPFESNYDYWVFTEVFVYLHGGADHCYEMKREKEKQSEQV